MGDKTAHHLTGRMGTGRLAFTTMPRSRLAPHPAIPGTRAARGASKQQRLLLSTNASVISVCNARVAHDATSSEDNEKTRS